MYFKLVTGKNGEDLACQYLINTNYSILNRNFRCKQGEIDIIAIDNSSGELVFFEVKTRSNLKFGEPIEAVNSKKQNHIFSACKYYVYLNKIINFPIRIDIIEVFLYYKTNTYKINHIKSVF